MKLRILQHVNKTSCHTTQYVQQGKCPPINIQNFLIYMCILIYIHDIVWKLSKKQPELLTPPLLLLHQMARDQINSNKRRIGL